MTRAKAQKKTKGKPPKKGLPWFAWLLITLAIAGVVVFAHIYPMDQPPADNGGKSKAAIVDQLSSFQENEDFIGNVTKELEDYGFEVDLYQGGNITVDFYRQLPSYGYDLIIFRAHSGLLGSKGERIERTCLFTNEPYSEAKHVAEQLGDQLAKARIDEYHPWVFGIGDEFVTQSMEGQFDNAVIIMMGCSCFYLMDLATAFIDKGASVYLAWDASVTLDYVDRATPYLAGQLCSEKVTIKEAVNSTMDVVGLDPQHEAVLKYYPSGTGAKTLEELIR